MDQFELQRCSDGLRYRFERAGPGMFRRCDDADMKICWEGMWGWVARLPGSGVLSGRPWEILPAHQSDLCPPQGLWLSQKEGRSCVYTLTYA